MYSENKKIQSSVNLILILCCDVKAEFPFKFAKKLIVYRRASVVSLKAGNVFSFFYEHFRNITYRAKLRRSMQKRCEANRKGLYSKLILLCEPTKSMEYGSPNIPEIAWV